MADNTPSTETVETTLPPTEEELIGEISDLLDDSEGNPVEEHEEANAAPDEEDDPLGLGEEADEETDADDDPDGQPEIKGGRFAPDTAKVTLDDGTVITVKELKRNNLYHAGFTQKTQELAKEKETFDSERRELSEYAQSLNQARDYVAWYAETHLPKDPGPYAGAPDDFIGYQEWQKSRDAWQMHAQAYQAFQYQKEQDEQKRTGETMAQAKKRHEAERAKLLEAIPVLKDPTKGKQVWDNIVNGAQEHYQLTAQEVNSVGDHRMLKVLRDALAYRQLKAKAPKVKEEVAKRPVNPGRRQAPRAQQVKAAQGRLERLKRDPSLENGAASLMDFDL